jgi:hypothetical protein
MRSILAMSDRTLLPSARQDDVGIPEHNVFEAQYPARTFPCQRFNGGLATAAA